MKETVICGAGGLGREIYSLIERIKSTSPSTWNVTAFIDNAKAGESINGVKVFTEDWLLDQNREINAFFGFANCKGKERLYEKLKKAGHITFPTLAAPTSIIDSSARIGEGCIIADFCFVSTDVTIGNGVLMNVGVAVGHDTVLGDFTTVMSGSNISGFVSIGKRSLVGAKSFILQDISVGDDSTVAAGSCAFWDIPECVTAFGNPAYILKKGKGAKTHD